MDGPPGAPERRPFDVAAQPPIERIGQLGKEQKELRLPFQVMPPAQEATFRWISMAYVVQHPPQPETVDEGSGKKDLDEAQHDLPNVLPCLLVC